MRKERIGSYTVLAASLSCIVATLVGAFGASAQEARLDSLILAQMERHGLPGLAAAAVDSGRTVWTGTYGLANVEERRPVTAETPFHIASMSKPVTATVLLSLYAQGRLRLDEDINAYLPFRVRNPQHPAVSITIRQLLRHRSSIADNSEYYGPFWSQADGDPTVGLGDYLRDYLEEGGANYEPTANFLTAEPGAQRRYCNTCYALLGYLAEAISSTPFERLAADRLFTPLGMSETAWFLRDLDPRTLAMPYRQAADTGFVAYGHNGYPDWPAGQLRSSIRDLGRFLAVYSSGGGSVIDERVIDVLSPADADVGFHTWSQMALRNRQILYVHQGGDIGVRTVMGFQRSRARGVVVVANGEGLVMPIFEEIFLALDSLPNPQR